jgi:sarcosine oxidase/L-pipecolate oxidase
VQDLVPADDLVELRSHAAIVRTAGAGGGSGTWGYLNKASGWADAEASMRWLRDKVAALGRVRFLTGEATALLYSSSHDKVLGARLADGSTLRADLTIVAAGAWTPTLVDLSGRALATGQVLAYVQISDAEQERLSKMPVQLNFSTGMFVIPPSRNILKVARHGYGYTNPAAIAHPSPSRRGESLTVSMPATADTHPGLWIPAEAERACRQALREMVPELGEREFVKTRVCWYTDTPRGDFLITYHPEHEGLFMATGGSGHGFKFLPVIGDAIVDTLEGRCPEEFREKWAWPKERVASVVTEDGSRGGAPGLVLAEELGRGGGVGCRGRLEVDG